MIANLILNLWCFIVTNLVQGLLISCVIAFYIEAFSVGEKKRIENLFNFLCLKNLGLYCLEKSKKYKLSFINDSIEFITIIFKAIF